MFVVESDGLPNACVETAHEAQMEFASRFHAHFCSETEGFVRAFRPDGTAIQDCRIVMSVSGFLNVVWHKR